MVKNKHGLIAKVLITVIKTKNWQESSFFFLFNLAELSDFTLFGSPPTPEEGKKDTRSILYGVEEDKNRLVFITYAAKGVSWSITTFFS